MPGAPNPNALGVAPFCPCPVAPKLNGELAPPPVDVEGVTGVNTNVGGLGPVGPFVFVVVEAVVVPGVLETKGDVGLFVAGAGVGVMVLEPNALTGVDVVPNTLPFVSGLGPGLEASCFGASENTPGDVPLVGFKDGKVTFESDPPPGLLTATLKWG